MMRHLNGRIVGLGVDADVFEEYQDPHTRAVPQSHVWLPNGDVVVGCAGGQILRVSL